MVRGFMQKSFQVLCDFGLSSLSLCEFSELLFLHFEGMHHQGVFRVSGSQHEINDMKNAFEKGIISLTLIY